MQEKRKDGRGGQSCKWSRQEGKAEMIQKRKGIVASSNSIPTSGP